MKINVSSLVSGSWRRVTGFLSLSYSPQHIKYRMTYSNVDNGLYLPVEEFSTSWQYTFADCLLLTAYALKRSVGMPTLKIVLKKRQVNLTPATSRQ